MNFNFKNTFLTAVNLFFFIALFIATAGMWALYVHEGKIGSLCISVTYYLLALRFLWEMYANSKGRILHLFLYIVRGQNDTLP